MFYFKNRLYYFVIFFLFPSMGAAHRVLISMIVSRRLHPGGEAAAFKFISIQLVPDYLVEFLI
jgi:hypothetical protein